MLCFCQCRCGCPLSAEISWLMRKERMMESSPQTENSGLSGLQVCPQPESCLRSNELRQIIVPVDMTRDCPIGIDFAICFAKTFGSTLNLIYLYQEPYIVDQSSR